MNIRGLARLSFLTTKFEAGASRSVRSDRVDKLTVKGDDTAALQKQQASKGAAEQGLGKAQAPGQQRLRYQQELALLLQNQDVNETANSSNADPVAAQQSGGVTSDKSANANLHDLATQYVAQYQRNADTKLTDEEFKQRIEEVYQFYSQPSRAGRLEQIVFE